MKRSYTFEAVALYAVSFEHAPHCGAFYFRKKITRNVLSGKHRFPFRNRYVLLV